MLYGGPPPPRTCEGCRGTGRYPTEQGTDFCTCSKGAAMSLRAEWQKMTPAQQREKRVNEALIWLRNQADGRGALIIEEVERLRALVTNGTKGGG